jgi:hypothetical protein
MLKPGEVSEQVRDQAIAPVECDVPVGWSLDEWRAVRGMARDVTGVSHVHWWRRLRGSARRPLN